VWKRSRRFLRARGEGGAFCSLEEFLRRVTVECDEIQALIKCGAFDEVCNMTRPAMLWHWNLLQAACKSTQQNTPRLRKIHPGRRRRAPHGARDGTAEKNRKVICGGKRCRRDWRDAGGNADTRIHDRTKIKIRARTFGSLRERAPAGFFAAQRRSLE